MRLICIFLFILTINMFAFGQITNTKDSSLVLPNARMEYDSLDNFLGKNFNKYIGQELYLSGKPEILRSFGYAGFSLDYKKHRYSYSNTYKPLMTKDGKYVKATLGGGFSYYDSLAGKYFEVISFESHPDTCIDEIIFGKKCFFKLKEKKSGDIVYFEYDSEFEYLFPFIVTGYFNKLKVTEPGKEYIVRGKNWNPTGPMIDIQTGNPVSNFVAGAKWMCVDVAIDKKYYKLSLILENYKKEQIAISISNAKKNTWIFDLEQSNLYKQKYGESDWLLILEGNLKVGMSKEMCELSWGKPQCIYETITAGKKIEEWVYKKNYLFFDSDVLTAIQ